MKLFFQWNKKTPDRSEVLTKKLTTKTTKTVLSATNIRFYFPSSTVICETVVIIVPAVIK